MGLRATAAVCASIVLVVIALAAVVVARDTAGEPDQGPMVRAPSTDEERRAATAATAFVRVLRARDATTACRALASRTLRREFACARGPRIPARYAVGRSEDVRVLDVPAVNADGSIAIGIPVRSFPVMRLTIDAGGRIADISGYGFA